MGRVQPILVVFLSFLLFGVGLGQEPQPEKPIFLSGSVMYADGSPADMTAKVELWCDRLVRRQVPTLDGVFSLQVGGSTVAPTTFDAEGGRSLEILSGPRYVQSRRNRNVIPLVDLTGCELRAQQEGFQSDEINLSFRRPSDNPDVGALVLYQAGSIVGTIDSVTTMKAPRQARKRLRRALKEMRTRKPNFEKAAAELEKATKLYPEYSEAWNLLGQVRLQLQDESGAQQAFELAAAGDPNYLGPQIAMMELESQRSDWDHVSQWSTKILELHSHQMQAHYFRGVANLNLRHMEQAEESLSTVRASLKADDYPYAGYLLGLMLADKGDFAAAATELKHFLKLVPLAPERARVTDFLSNWEKKGLIQGAEKN